MVILKCQPSIFQPACMWQYIAELTILGHSPFVALPVKTENDIQFNSRMNLYFMERIIFIRWLVLHYYLPCEVLASTVLLVDFVHYFSALFCSKRLQLISI